jgi:hypothetical protein
VLTEVGQVRVDVHEDVAAGHVLRLPQHLTLAGVRPELGQDGVAVVDGRPRIGGDRGGLVGRARVDDQHLVDEAGTVGEADHSRHDLAHRGFLVEGGQYDAHP